MDEPQLIVLFALMHIPEDLADNEILIAHGDHFEMVCGDDKLWQAWLIGSTSMKYGIF